MEERHFCLKIMELNNKERFSILDADTANIFICFLLVLHCRQGGREKIEI